MRKRIAVSLVLLVGLGWWIAAAPRHEIPVSGSVVFDRSTRTAIAAVDDSAGFAAGLEHFPSDLPPFDDAVFLQGRTAALVTATDGKIWTVDLATHAAEPFADPPLMAYGIHEAPGDPGHVYFCASRSYRLASPGERVGLYRLTLADRSIQPVVLDVPATSLDNERPVVYADDDAKAPELRTGATGVARRALMVCDNLEVSEDGRRIYFSEPFDYTGASVDDAVDEAIALAPNGRLWRHDLDSNTTRLVAEGFHYINGVLYDLHPGQPRESSVLVTQTSLFRLTRFYLRGPRAGTSEVALDGITGMDDGMDRDAEGRIWLALFTERGSLLTWVHAHAWLKPLFMRLPARLLLRRTRPTGVVVVSPDGTKPLYGAMYQGPMLSSVASAVAGPSGIYLANESLNSTDRVQTGVVRLKWPRQLR
jgi:sugar lactone lactonase YvrE